jgi:hypothetical protein
MAPASTSRASWLSEIESLACRFVTLMVAPTAPRSNTIDARCVVRRFPSLSRTITKWTRIVIDFGDGLDENDTLRRDGHIPASSSRNLSHCIHEPPNAGPPRPLRIDNSG